MFRYGLNMITCLWEVFVGDVVMRHFQTGEECEQWIKEQMEERRKKSEDQA